MKIIKYALCKVHLRMCSRFVDTFFTKKMSFTTFDFVKYKKTLKSFK